MSSSQGQHATPPMVFNRRNVLRLAGASVPAIAGLAIGGGFARAATTRAASPALTRPTGAGIFAYEDLGVKGLTAAMAAAMAAAKKEGRSSATLTLPGQVFETAGFGQSANNTGYLVPANLSIVGSGAATILRVAENSMTSAQAAKVPTAPRGATNPLQLMMVPPSTGVTMSQFTLQGTAQNGHFYNGMNLFRCTNPVLSALKISGVRGYYNSPPGETFALNVNSGSGMKMTSVEVDGRDADTGKKVSAAGIAFNNTSSVQLHSCYAHDMYYSAGVTFWQTTGVTSYNLTVQNNGTTLAQGGTWASMSPGLNHEKTRNTLHNNLVIGNNALTEVRYYAQPKTGSDPYSGNTTSHEIDGCTVSDGGAFNVLIANAQTSVPTLISSPKPVYLYD